jgi:hypothetical protein
MTPPLDIARSIETPELPQLSPAEQAYFDDLVAFVKALPPDEAQLVDELADLGRKYQGDIDAEVADWNAGRHPFQQRRR